MNNSAPTLLLGMGKDTDQICNQKYDLVIRNQNEFVGELSIR